MTANRTKTYAGRTQTNNRLTVCVRRSPESVAMQSLTKWAWVDLNYRPHAYQAGVAKVGRRRFTDSFPLFTAHATFVANVSTRVSRHPRVRRAYTGKLGARQAGAGNRAGFEGPRTQFVRARIHQQACAVNVANRSGLTLEVAA